MSSCLPQPEQCPIVVTGVGVVSALGIGWAGHGHSFRTERMGFSEVTRFDVSQRLAHTAALVELPAEKIFTSLSRRQEQRVDHGSRMLLVAMREAISHAKLPGVRGHVDGIYIGTSAGAMEHGEAYTKRQLASSKRLPGQLTLVEHYQPQRQMCTVADELGWDGQIVLVSNACASGANSIGMGMELIRSGRAQCVIVGGYDAISELVFAGFDVLRALAVSGIPRPFDAQRDGLALGEGAGVMVLETASHALARGAQPLAVLGGYHTATDLHHLTQPDPMGAAAVKTMTQACKMAGVSANEIDYINSHGTGTPFNDVAEGTAIGLWAGDAVGKVAVSSTKSAMGHLLGGAGAVEAAVCVMALVEQWLPASLNVRTPDPVVTFDLVTQFRPEVRVRHALTNSFGFGGTNASLVFSAS